MKNIGMPWILRLNSERLVKFASSFGKEVKFVVNYDSDHNEALLKEPEIIQENLVKFFQKNLPIN